MSKAMGAAAATAGYEKTAAQGEAGARDIAVGRAEALAGNLKLRRR